MQCQLVKVLACCSLAGKDLLHAAVLQNVMGMGPSIKYSSGTATARLTQAVACATSKPFAVSGLGTGGWWLTVNSTVS